MRAVRAVRAARCTWQRGEGSEGSEGGEGGEGSEGGEGGEGGTFRSSGRNRTSAVAGWQQPAPSCSSCEFVTRAMYMYPWNFKLPWNFPAHQIGTQQL